MQKTPLTNSVLVDDGIAVTLEFIISGETAVEGCDLIHPNSGGLSVLLFHNMLLSDSPQAVLHIPVLLRISQGICFFMGVFLCNGRVCRKAAYAAVAMDIVSFASSFSISLFTLS